MNIIASGSILLGRGERLSVQAGPATYYFNERPEAGAAVPNDSMNVSVPFDLPNGMATGFTGNYRAGGVLLRHRFRFSSGGLPDQALVHYTITAE